MVIVEKKRVSFPVSCSPCKHASTDLNIETSQSVSLSIPEISIPCLIHSWCREPEYFLRPERSAVTNLYRGPRQEITTQIARAKTDCDQLLDQLLEMVHGYTSQIQRPKSYAEPREVSAGRSRKALSRITCLRS